QNVIGRDSLNDLADDRPCPLGVVPNELSEFVGRREVFGVCTVPHACCCMGNVCSDEIFIFHEASSTRQWDRRWTTTLARNPAMATDSGGRRKTSIQQEYRRILARAGPSGWFRWLQFSGFTFETSSCTPRPRGWRRSGILESEPTEVTEVTLRLSCTTPR